MKIELNTLTNEMVLKLVTERSVTLDMLTTDEVEYLRSETTSQTDRKLLTENKEITDSILRKKELNDRIRTFVKNGYTITEKYPKGVEVKLKVLESDSDLLDRIRTEIKPFRTLFNNSRKKDNDLANKIINL